MNRRKHKKKLKNLCRKLSEEHGMKFICRYSNPLSSGVILKGEEKYLYDVHMSYIPSKKKKNKKVKRSKCKVEQLKTVREELREAGYMV